MKLMQDVGQRKLRGGYYTPDPVVDWCIGRIIQLRGSKQFGRVLEPSAGDGAFIRGIARATGKSPGGGTFIHAVELEDIEARKCELALRQTGLRGDVSATSCFRWLATAPGDFDVVVGNPPYVRYQFVPPGDRKAAERLVGGLGIELRGVSNLWIPFAILSISALRPGGAFALVLPSELFATVSGGQFREYVTRECSSIRVDMFPRDTFPDILQDVVVVSGNRALKRSAHRVITFCEHHQGSAREWKHRCEVSPKTWVRFLLTADEMAAYDEATNLLGIRFLGEIAKFGVSTVTGANPFFTVDDSTVAEYGLKSWARPLLARTSDAPGVVFTTKDHLAARKGGSRAWLLDFSTDRSSPAEHAGARKYLQLGVDQSLPSRFKCRNRSPWYRVPVVRPGQLLLTKRAHQFHRVILNQAAVLTTDTVYRGELVDGAPISCRDLAAVFQNSLTLLSAEIEGRTYGGGVLELVPSEVARLRVPAIGIGALIPLLDAESRRCGGQRDCSESVLELVDVNIAKELSGYRSLLPRLREALVRLRSRRMNTIHAQTDPECDP